MRVPDLNGMNACKQCALSPTEVPVAVMSLERTSWCSRQLSIVLLLRPSSCLTHALHDSRPWKEWRPSEGAVMRWRTVGYVVLHAKEEIEQKLSRKVEVQFRPSDLKLSDKATKNLIEICGVRYNKNTGVVKLTSDTLALQKENRIRLECMVAQLIYFAKQTAGAKPAPKPAVAPPAPEGGEGGGAKAEAAAAAAV